VVWFSWRTATVGGPYKSKTEREQTENQEEPKRNPRTDLPGEEPGRKPRGRSATTNPRGKPQDSRTRPALQGAGKADRALIRGKASGESIMELLKERFLFVEGIF